MIYRNLGTRWKREVEETSPEGYGELGCWEKAGKDIRGMGHGQRREGEGISRRKESSTIQGRITHILPNTY